MSNGLRLIRYQADGGTAIGVEEAGTVHPVPGYESMRQLVTDVADGLDLRSARRSSRRLALSDLRVCAPIDDPGKVIAIGLNYREHVGEGNFDVPTAPLIFAKFPSSIIGPGDVIEWDAAYTSAVDLEAELAVIVGKRGRNVPEASAMEYVFGYT